VVKEEDALIERLSRSSLVCITKVAETAQSALQSYRRSGAGALASVNTFLDGKQVSSIDRIGVETREALVALAREPVVSRVSYIDEDGEEGTLFVTRGSPPPLDGLKLASYRAPSGRIASLPAGEGFQLRIGGRERWVTIQTSVKLHPHRDAEGWDSCGNEIDLDGFGKRTVVSLRALLEPRVAVVDEDLLTRLLAEEQEDNVLAGIRRSVLAHIGLRDQPILDQHQDEIFRLLINTCCFLSGPPGTGKTTTLIRRLGQKLDLDALDPAEAALVQRAEQNAPLPHQKSWLMFSPTELLRQYVKDAFAREGIPASADRIQTWSAYRRDFARNTLGILRTGTGRGQFVERQDEGHLEPNCGSTQARAWYEDFEDYLQQSFAAELIADAEHLGKSESDELAALGRRFRSLLEPYTRQPIGGAAAPIAAFSEDVQELADERKGDADRIVARALNRLLHEDRDFVAAFAQEVARQAAIQYAEQDDEDDLDSEFEDEDDELEASPTRSVSLKQVPVHYQKAVLAHARARARGRKLTEKSRSGRLVAWLGPERLPAREEIAQLARIGGERSRLRKFASLHSALLRSVPRIYKKYRRERHKEGRWYAAEPRSGADICWKELDLLILAILRLAGSVLDSYARASHVDLPERGALINIRGALRNQILVDEATDFSVIQLAAMRALAHPAIGSFFACGDFNQRLTPWGIAGDAELDWIAPDIDRRRITVSYRQSGKLVALAKRVAALGGASASDIALPDRLDNEGVAPVLRTHLCTDESVAEWLTERVREIETTVGALPTIAVLVSDEARVEPLAGTLSEKLADMNISAAACRRGEVVGNDRDVRVFDIQHIKGMEFEAVFFVDLDEIIEKEPDLYTKYLYVGATRAATYLGMTFRGELPPEIAPLSDAFQERWLAS
jgi:hypothetical protein